VALNRRPGMNAEGHRPIRSFVLRQGRLSAAQARSHAALLPVWGIPYAPARLDLDAVFGRRAPRILEIGFGMGEATAAIAAVNPDKDYVGVEVHTPGVGALLKRIAALGLTNVRVIQHDAVEVLANMIGEAALDGIHLFFPDPWPKKRHHKRRLVQPAFARLAASRLKAGGTLRLATDWPEYAEQMLAVLAAEPLLAGGDAPAPASRPQTRFESRGLKLGHPVRDLVFVRRPLREERAEECR